MDFLILVDNTFQNSYRDAFLDIANKKIKELSEKLELEVIVIDSLEHSDAYTHINYLYNMSEGFDNILYITSDTPLLDVDETIKLVSLHKDNMAYYTYGENYPKGIVPVAIRRSSFERLIPLAKDKKEINFNRDIIHNLIFADPNFFEIEILISDCDMRYYRLEFIANSKRNNILINNFIEFGDYDSVVNSIKESPHLRRTLPAYIELDITNTQNALYKISPIENSDRFEFMSLDTFKEIYKNIIDFSDDFHLSIGSFYEPLLNKNIFEILEYALEYKKANIYLETNGLCLNEETAKKILSIQKRFNNFFVLIRLDAVDSISYNNIYQMDNLSAILSNIDYYLLRGTKNTYMQIVKQKHNFDTLKDYYAYFDKYKVPIIMQKYSSFKNTIENNKVGDMAPLVNVCCWHLARDLYIDMFGVVPICKYDNKKEIILGNVLESGVPYIWDKGLSYYKENTLGILEFCNNCDDWYLYNF